MEAGSVHLVFLLIILYFNRILQKFFPRATLAEIEIFIREINSKIHELMLDSYANYMFQTLAQACSAEQRYYLLEKVLELFTSLT